MIIFPYFLRFICLVQLHPKMGQSRSVMRKENLVILRLRDDYEAGNFDLSEDAEDSAYKSLQEKLGYTHTIEQLKMIFYATIRSYND